RLLCRVGVRLGRELEVVQVVAAGIVPDRHHLGAGGEVDRRGEVLVVAPAAGVAEGDFARRDCRRGGAGAAAAEAQVRRGPVRAGGARVRAVGPRRGAVGGVVHPVAAGEVADVVGAAGVGERPLAADAFVGRVGAAGVLRVGAVVGDALAAVIEVFRL